MSITIKHLDGNLAEGQPKEQTFGDSVDTITFGRERDCQIVYAPEYTVVGKRHCQLVRQVTGDYRVNLLGQRYVEVNGVPADNNTVVPNGAVLRLGDPKDGPSFKVEIAKQVGRSAGHAPAAQGQIVAGIDDRDAGGSVPSRPACWCSLIAGSITYFMLRTTSLEDQIAEANAAASARAQKEFSEATLARLEAAVYLVAKQEDQSEEAEGTAWAFAPNLLATNAHVTQAILGHEDEFFLVASRRHAYQDQESRLASGLSRLRQVQDDARDDALRQFHPARPDQRI